jgi:hypothetical protein
MTPVSLRFRFILKFFQIFLFLFIKKRILPSNQYIGKIMKFFTPLLSISLLFSFPSISLYSDSSSSINCTGIACDALPTSYKNQINELPSQLESQYLTKILDNMNEASASVNSISSLQGMGSVNTFQIGAGISASGSQQEPLTVKYRDIQFKDLPNVGFGVSPNVMIGVNLGWLLGQGERDADDINNRSLLHRINLFASGFKVNTSTAENKGGVPESFHYTGNLSISQTGIGARIDIIQPGDGILIRFLGLNSGFSIRKQDFSFDLEDTKSSNAKFTLGSLNGTWNSQTNLEYSTRAYSIPIDFRTGFQILRMVSVFGGLGSSRSSSESNLLIQRSGPVRFSSNPAEIALTSTATTANITDADRAAGNLDMRLSEASKKSFVQSYALLGVEIDVWKLKLITEAYLMENVKSVSAGVKLDF